MNFYPYADARKDKNEPSFNNPALHTSLPKPINDLSLPLTATLTIPIEQDARSLIHIKRRLCPVSQRLGHVFRSPSRDITVQIEDAEQVDRTVDDEVAVAFDFTAPVSIDVDFVSVECEGRLAEECCLGLCVVAVV